MPNNPLNDAKNWPAVPPELLSWLTEWAMLPAHSAEYTKGMSGDDALGSLAFIKGMGHIIGKLKAVREKQLAVSQQQNIPSHVRTQ